MKKYNARIGFNIATVEDELKFEEREEGQWVPADVAQALYDALKGILDNYKHNERKGLGVGPIAKANAALSKADEE